MTKNDSDKTYQRLEELNSKIDKLLNWKHALGLGIIRGIGVAIGATIIAAIAFSIIAALARQADNIPLIRDFIPKDAIEETLNSR